MGKEQGQADIRLLIDGRFQKLGPASHCPAIVSEGPEEYPRDSEPYNARSWDSSAIDQDIPMIRQALPNDSNEDLRSHGVELIALSISSMQKGVSDQVKDLSRIYGQ
jgi:hypothetical protein